MWYWKIRIISVCQMCQVAAVYIKFRRNAGFAASTWWRCTVFGQYTSLRLWYKGARPSDTPGLGWLILNKPARMLKASSFPWYSWRYSKRHAEQLPQRKPGHWDKSNLNLAFWALNKSCINKAVFATVSVKSVVAVGHFHRMMLSWTVRNGTISKSSYAIKIHQCLCTKYDITYLRVHTMETFKIGTSTITAVNPSIASVETQSDGQPLTSSEPALRYINCPF